LDLTLWIELILFVVLLGFSAFFSSSENSLFPLNSMQIEKMRFACLIAGLGGAGGNRLVHHPDRRSRTLPGHRRAKRQYSDAYGPCSERPRRGFGRYPAL